MFKILSAVSTLAALAVGFPAAAAPAPASAFGRLPGVQDAAISPDGQKVAILGGGPDLRMLSIATIDKPDLPRLNLGAVETIGIRWAGDDYVLARIAYWDKLGPRDKYRLERNLVVNTRAQAVSRLLDSDTASAFLIQQPVVGIVPGPKAEALVMGLDWNAGDKGNINTHIPRKGAADTFVYTLWKVEVGSDKASIVERADVNTDGWGVDLTGEPRARMDINYSTHAFTLLGRPKGSKRWTTVQSSSDEEDERHFYGYSDPDDALYLAQGDQLVLKHLSDGSTTPVGKPAKTSISLVWDEHRGAAAGIASGAEKPEIEWIDPEIGAVHTALSRAFKDRRVDLESWSRDRTRFVFRVSAPGVPGVWYLFDKPRREISPLGDEYPELKGVAFGPTRWLTYKARDGLEISAYLTLPPGAAVGGAKLPLIVFPHGGPAARDGYDFDFWAQFMASRGYAVLQPQFRGSWGFGEDFELAGRKEWGGKMQTDLLDGIAAVAAQGLIDPGRVCIVGASFGGYAALAGVTLHPEAYRCAASVAGISDLSLLIGEDSHTYGKDSGSLRYLKRMLGEGGGGDPSLAATSPAKLVANVRAPILLIHGDHDTTVQPKQSEVMFHAMQDAGKAVQYVVLVGEDHYLSKSATRTQMLETLDAFLAKNLPVNP